MRFKWDPRYIGIFTGFMYRTVDLARRVATDDGAQQALRDTAGTFCSRRTHLVPAGASASLILTEKFVLSVEQESSREQDY